MKPLELAGLAVAGAVLYASFAVKSSCGCGARFGSTCGCGSRAAHPKNPCARLASLHRDLGHEDDADAYDAISEDPSLAVLDQCSTEFSELRAKRRRAS